MEWGRRTPTAKLDVNGTIKATGFSGPVTSSNVATSAGTAAAPSYTFSTDANTGFYSAAADTMGVSVGGSNIFDLSAAGMVSATAGGGLVTTAAGSAAAPTYSFSGDTDTGWYSPAANTLAAATGGVERVRIDSAGNIGIGSTSPLGKLSLMGSSALATATNYNGQDFGLIIGRDNGENLGDEGQGIVFTQQYAADATDASQVRTSAIIGYKDQAVGNFGGGMKIKVQPAGATPMNDAVVVDKQSRVGIATAPTAHLDVRGGSYPTGTQVQFTSSNSWDKILFGSQVGINQITGDHSAIYTTAGDGSTDPGYPFNHNGNYGTLVIQGRNDAANGGIAFRTGAGAGQDNRMVITPSGNVGIGTTTPSYNLSFGGDAARTIAMERNTTTAGSILTVGSGGALSGGTNLNGGDLYLKSGTSTGTGSSDIYFQTATSGATGTTDNAPSTKMTIWGNGFVGIGTSSPQTTLHIDSGVAGATPFTYSAYGANSGLVLNAYELNATANYERYGDIGVLGDSGFAGSHLRFLTQGDADSSLQERVRITKTGNVGIGTTSPSAKLGIQTPGLASSETGLAISNPSTAAYSTANFNFSTAGAWKSAFWTMRNNIGLGGIFGITTADSSGAGQERLRITDTGNVGVGTTTPASKLEVAGEIAGKAYKTRLFQAGGKTAPSCTLSSTNPIPMVDQFCELSISLTLTDAASVQINYSITMMAGGVGGVGSKHLVTGIDIDGTTVTSTITGIQTTDATYPTAVYWGNSESHFASLAAGSHTIKVLYRTPAGGTNNPSGDDWQNRKLQVMILGYQ